MKTTLDLRDELLTQAKIAAARERTTLTKMIEEGLVLRLRRTPAPNASLGELPVSRRRGGLCAGVDGASNRAMFDAAETDAAEP